MEQEFTLLNISKQLPKMDGKDKDELLLQIVRQAMIKDNIIRQIVKS